MNNDYGIDWIVSKEEKVSSVFILNLNGTNSLTLKQAGSRTHSRATLDTAIIEKDKYAKPSGRDIL